MQDGEEKGRAIGWAKIAVIGVIAVILVGAIGYFVGSRAVPQTNLYSDHGNVSVDLAEDNGAIPTFSGPSPSEVAANQVAPVVPVAPVAQPPKPAPDPMAGSVADDAPVDNGLAPATSDADLQGQQEIGDAIQSATQDALNRGASVRWHKDGLSGFAIAGAATADGGRTCRNAYVTTVRDGGETRTPTVRWCRSGGDGAWAAQ